MKYNCITITTDASYCNKTKSAGYAFRIKWSDGELNKGGQFKGKINNSTDAEIKCAANALYAFGLLEISSKLLVLNTDCQTIVSPTDKEHKITEAHKEMLRIAQVLNVDKIDYRHVKSHSGVHDNRSKANKWCDREAKRQMKALREGVKLLDGGFRT
jgi:ribonuclease HI